MIRIFKSTALPILTIGFGCLYEVLVGGHKPFISDVYLAGTSVFIPAAGLLFISQYYRIRYFKTIVLLFLSVASLLITFALVTADPAAESTVVGPGYIFIFLVLGLLSLNNDDAYSSTDERPFRHEETRET